MEKIKFDILSINQIIGSKRLEIFNKIGTQCANTYFAQVLGVSSSNTLITKSLYSEDRNYLVKATINDKECYSDIFSTDTMIRPITKYSNIRNHAKNKKVNEQKILEVEYGEFPMENVSKGMNDILETQYKKNLLYKTNQTITTFEVRNRYDFKVEQTSNDVYVYNCEKYIRFVGRFNSYNSNYSNTILWIKLSPIKWLIDEENDIAITKDSIYSGIPFNDIRKYNDNFNETLLYRYLNEIFCMEIVPSLNMGKIQNIVRIVEEDKEIKTEKIENVLKYVLLCEKLKTIISNTCRNLNIENERLESIAEQVYSTQMLALAMISEFKYNINIYKVILMLAIHKVGNVYISDNIVEKEKQIKGVEAAHKIFRELLNGDYIEDLYSEYEYEHTKEGKFAKQCDRLQTHIMLKKYEGQNKQLSQELNMKEISNGFYDKNFTSFANYLLENDIKRFILK